MKPVVTASSAPESQSGAALRAVASVEILSLDSTLEISHSSDRYSTTLYDRELLAQLCKRRQHGYDDNDSPWGYEE